MMANPAHQETTVEQDVPYRDGQPEILQVEPNGNLSADSMFRGPELVHIHSTFGYRDRETRRDKNPFTPYQNTERGEWFPNIIAVRT